MDARYEFWQTNALNNLIATINQYVKNNIEHFFDNPDICEEVTKIVSNIYSHLGLDVDVDNILSRHNLLSIDVVLLPSIDESLVSHDDKQSFLKWLDAIDAMIQVERDELLVNRELKENLKKIILECQSEYA